MKLSERWEKFVREVGWRGGDMERRKLSYYHGYADALLMILDHGVSARAADAALQFCREAREYLEESSHEARDDRADHR